MRSDETHLKTVRQECPPGTHYLLRGPGDYWGGVFVPDGYIKPVMPFWRRFARRVKRVFVKEEIDE